MIMEALSIFSSCESVFTGNSFSLFVPEELFYFSFYFIVLLGNFLLNKMLNLFIETPKDHTNRSALRGV